MNILIVEDNQALREALHEHLLQAGHILEAASTLAEAKSFWQLKSDDFDLVVLDLNLPDGLGSELLRTIDQSNARTGVLVLTARADLTDVVDLLDQGADDYLTKPFQFPELDARIRAIHRRRSQRCAGTQYWFGLEFDELAGIFWHQGQQLDLRQKERQLLEAFIQSPSAQCTRESLMNRLYRLDEVVSENAIEVHVGRLRRKLSDTPVKIQSVRGVGYRAYSDE